MSALKSFPLALLNFYSPMSYNGIGLQTARGSGTSGHIQTNLAKRDVKPKRRKIAVQDTRNRLELGSAIRKHNSKREIQVKCMELRDELEDQGLDDEVIDNRVQELKQKLEKDGEQENEKDEDEDNEHTKDKENGDEEENKDEGENKDEEEYKDENRHKHELDNGQNRKHYDNDKDGDLKYNDNDKDEDDKHEDNNTEECEHEKNNEKDHNATGYDYQTGNYTKLNHKNQEVITELTQHKPVHEISQIKTSHHNGKKGLKGGKGDVDRETVAAASSKSVPEYIPRYKK